MVVMNGPFLLAGFDRDHSPLIEAIDVRLLQLPMTEALTANHGTTSVRPLAVIGLGFTNQSGTATWAWGESAALPTSGYTVESAADSYEALLQVAPELVGRNARELLPVPEAESSSPIPTGLLNLGPLSAAALEMASLDAIGKNFHRSLAQMLGSQASRCPAGAAIGLGPVDDVISACRRLVEAGYCRIKLKIEPGHDVDVATRVVNEVKADVAWHVDANGSYNDDGIDTMMQLANIGVAAIEQPFDPKDLAAASRLVSELASHDLGCLVTADEAAVDAAAIVRLHDEQAATAVTIKPSRYGGLAATLPIVEQCRALGFALSAGGMIESALGRHALAALAGHEAFTVTGDLSPSRRWMSMDPWPDLATDHNTDRGALMVETPTGSGVAPAPDTDVLDRLAASRQLVD